jgi:hypothetical protein
LPADLNAAAALALAQSTLAADPDLSSKYGLSGGAFDGNNMSLLDPATGDDWLIPYERGGVYTGEFLLSAHYGILEEASWDDLGDLPTSLSDLTLEYQGIEDGFHPDDNPTTPEASTLVLAAIGSVLLGLKRGQRLSAARC